MSRSRFSDVVCLLLLAFIWTACTGPAHAACEHPIPPAGSWRSLWTPSKTGANFMEGTWQAQCAREPNPGQYGNDKRYLSVCDAGFPGTVTAQCYGGLDPERVVHIPSSTPQPSFSTDLFDPNDSRNCYSLSGGPLPWRGLVDTNRNCLHAQFETPYVPNAENNRPFQGALERTASPGFCIDVPQGKLDEGTQLYAYDCQNSVNQQVRLSFGNRGQIVVMPGSNGARGAPMCLDYFPGGGSANDPVRIWPCHPLYSGIRDSQVWFPDHRQLRSITGRCLSADRNGRALLVLADCPETGGQPSAFDWGAHATFRVQSQPSTFGLPPALVAPPAPQLSPPPFLPAPGLPPLPQAPSVPKLPPLPSLPGSDAR